jgi:hypothetical protein
MSTKSWGAFILFILVFSISTHTAIADSDPLTTWPIEERCIAEPALPPDDWSYPGTILMSGYAGIHGVQADWETPRVVVFLRRDENGDEPLIGGQLSPDGRWYAVPYGENFTEVSYNEYFFVHSLRLYSTSDDAILSFDLDNYRDIYIYNAVAWSYMPVLWTDDNALVFGKILLHPFEHLAKEAPFDWTNSTLLPRYISPDLTLVYGAIWLDSGFIAGVYESTNPEALLVELKGVNGLSWRHDSSGFIAAVTQGEPSWSGLAYYDRNGILVERIFDLGGGSIVGFSSTNPSRNEMPWSPDGQYFAFVQSLYPEPSRLYIIDWEEQIVIDTCLSSSSMPVWSPDGAMLAYLAPARRNTRVVVVDMQSWQAYDVARHLGGDMVGWRETE